MNPENLEKHFARIHQTYKTYDMVSAEQVFNLHESGLSTRGLIRGRAKEIFEKNRASISNEIDLKWVCNAEHVTVMPAVFPNGCIWSPVVIIQGKRKK